jgi:hypothetical protein
VSDGVSTNGTLIDGAWFGFIAQHRFVLAADVALRKRRAAGVSATDTGTDAQLWWASRS